MSDDESRAPLVEVTALPHDPRLRGHSLDAIVANRACAGRELRIAGWVLGQAGQVVAIEIASPSDRVIKRLPLVHRADVLAAYPDVSGSIPTGFEGGILYLECSALTLILSAVLPNQERIPLVTMSVTQPERALPPVPRVSVVIPCYRQSHFLREAIESAVRQTHSSIEVVVVDDGSPDNTEAVALSIPGLVYVRQRNRGLSAARNTGLRHCTGQFVVFLDADDRLMPNMIATGLIHFSQNPDIGLVAGHFRLISANGRVLGVPEQRTAAADHYVELIRDYFVGPPGGILWRRATLEQVGGFDASVNPAADYDMTLRVARVSAIAVHDEVVLEYRRHGANMSGDPASMLVTTMVALKKQRASVLKRRGGRRAYRAGLEHWRVSWGVPLVEKIAADLRAGRVTSLPRDVGALLRYYPAGIVDILRRVVRRP